MTVGIRGSSGIGAAAPGAGVMLGGAISRALDGVMFEN